MITEPDVALTDYGLAIECAFFTYVIYHQGDRAFPVRTWFAVFFGSISVASFAGGTVHGFFLDEQTLGYAILWPAALMTVGVTALATWSIGASLLFSAKFARRTRFAAAVEFASYCLAVLFLRQDFWIAIVNYLPAAAFLLIALVTEYRRSHEKEMLVGIAGLVLTFAASLLQHVGVSAHPVYFNHNALYHFIQAVALFMIFRTAKTLVVARSA